MRYQILILAMLALAGCAHKPAKNDSALAEKRAVNLYVYRLEIGFKSSPAPVAELWMPREEFNKFVATKEFRDREFRQNTFHNGCYLFRHRETVNGREVASAAEPIYCYNSARDVFLPKSPLLGGRD